MAPAVSQDLWQARDTTPDAIEAALRDLLRQRHAANAALVPARVLNLVVIVDREWKGEIANRLARVGRYHASRTVLCAVGEGRRTIDATVVMEFDEPRNGGIGVIRERVEIDLGPDHLARLDTIVDPLLVSELPTVVWSPHGHDQAVQALLGMIDVILVDSDDLGEPRAALERAADLLRSAYVVDLAWLRTTPWRERLAASFDPPDRRRALNGITGVVVRHAPSSAASALVLLGWLASRLHWNVTTLGPSNGASALCGTAERGGGEVELELAPADQDSPGLGGVTISWGDGCSLSLDRGRGGLRARLVSPDGSERGWHVLGASRGEGGILGEGVRQALLRDGTYGPALDAALRLCP
jgi:glucose-6-phosphate dehydrogenase assembly protein OpcA